MVFRKSDRIRLIFREVSCCYFGLRQVELVDIAYRAGLIAVLTNDIIEYQTHDLVERLFLAEAFVEHADLSVKLLGFFIGQVPSCLSKNDIFTKALLECCSFTTYQPSITRRFACLVDWLVRQSNQSCVVRMLSELFSLLLYIFNEESQRGLCF